MKHRTTWSVATAMVAAVLLATVQGQQASQQAEAQRQQPRPPEAYTADEVLVQFSPTLNAAQRNGVIAGRGANRIRRFETLDIDHLRLPPGLSVDAAVAAFLRIPGVLRAQPNYTRHMIPVTTPNDPSWLDGSLWGLSKIQAPSVWTDFTVGDGSVIVANIDTGVDYTHPDLAANMWRNPLEIPGNHVDDDGNGYVDDVFGIDTANHDSDPMDDQGHGTHTAGTVAAVGNNGIGVVGVNWNARILACKFLDASGYGTDAGAIECFNYIVAQRNRAVNVRVSSNSWGGARGSTPPASALIAAIDAAGAVGIVNIFGAGNDGTDNDIAPFDPASYPSPSIVAVASSGATDRKSSFSNYGATSVDLAAPGENILSTYPGADYASLSGTSMATPHVAGVAALLAQLDPSLSAEAIKALLIENVDQSSRWTGRVASGGRLNAYKAAQAVGPGTPNEKPTASIISPMNGSVYKAPATFTIDALADDTDGSIRQVAFYANGAPIGVDTTSPFSVTWVNAPAGNYTLTAVATDDRYATGVSAPVSVIVLPNAPPVVTITNPIAGATFASPATVTIDATATDSDGTVQLVTFFANGVAIGTDATSPYSVTWTPAMGSYSLTAMAADNEGGTASSAAVPITIDPIPGRINVALAANGALASASSTLSAKYPPSGAINGDRKGLNWGNGGGWNDGTQNQGPDWLEVGLKGLKLIEEINVFSMQDNYSAPIEPTPTMTFSYFGLRGFEVQYWTGSEWAAVPGGTIANNNLVWRRVVFAPVTTTKIRIHITAALNGYSRVMEVEAWGVAAGGNAPPDVSVTAPAEGASFTAPASITVNAAASDSDGNVQQVEFFANGASIGTDTTSPYSVTWTGVSAGTYALAAIATDNEGATTTSNVVNVTVLAANVPPSVAISSPAEGATFTAPSSVTVTANASDSDGSIVSVAFFANGAPIGTASANPFSVVWSTTQAGVYALTAVATDNRGGTATSAAVNVTVAQSPNRMNVALASNGAVATASSTYNANYPPAGAINGDRRGLNWGRGGGWNDGTANASPDWIEVAFNGSKTIDEINVFSMQDNYSAPAEPTPTMTFTSWGLRGFEVQYWTGSAWAAVPGGTIVNNNLVWRRVTFSAITTTRIRIYITAALQGYSRVMEVEAWGGPAAAMVAAAVR